MDNESDPLPATQPIPRLDWMCIDIVKVGETDTHADYEYRCGEWVPDPGRRNRWMRTGKAAGLLRIHKASGRIEFIAPIAADTANRVNFRAAGKVVSHWKRGEYPERTQYACG